MEEKLLVYIAGYPERKDKASTASVQSAGQSLQQWWDVAKAQIKQLCQQYTHNVTRGITYSIKAIKRELVELQGLADNPSDIQKRAVRFYENLYKSELTDEQTVGNVFLENLPQLSEEANAELSKALTLEELDRALQSMVWQKPLIYGSRLDISHDGPLPPLGGILLSSGVTTLGHLSRLAGKGFKNIDLVAGHLGIRSARIVDKVLENWRPALTQEEFKLLEDYAEGLTVPNSSDPYPNLFFSPNLEDWAVCYLVYQGSMAAPGVQALSTLTRRHAIKVVSTASVEDCCMAVGEVVGHECILSASRMNNAMVIFLNSIERVNELVEHGVVIGGEFVSVLPLSQPSKRVTLSNVPPFLSDDILTNALSRYGKIVSPIKKIPISSVSPLLKHIVSFRRFVYMIVQDDAELDLSLSFKVDGFEYVIFVTTAKTRCFGCGNFGHLIRNCPDKLNEKETIEGGNAEPAPSTSKVIEAGPVGSESPGLSRTETESVTGKGPVAASVAEVGSIAVNRACLRAADAELSVSESGDGVQVSGSSVKKQACDATENIVESMLQNVCEVNGVDMEVEQNLFKVPQKKKKRGNSQDAKVLRKLDLQASDDQETESDSELSDSSVVLSQNDFSSRNYDVEDIKLFLKSTKNKRGVCVQEYFPDIKQFVEKTRNLMVEGCFTNKEVYRLKKIVRNLNKDLNNDV
ncbi:Transposon TX1 uncharacterized 82 kDa protein [Labeo rohita]|uniref:Transposon TX1 uncharacterized 82 kDa protein n=1 Tax=Labeo rohita TaxID=84645 RepID=A0ABQ8L7V4_LABRO|nr:Transposon TX1 uncharacterized 82 kDa protein [Labeo rohita]